jgi:S1-C subfamily serine protease
MTPLWRSRRFALTLLLLLLTLAATSIMASAQPQGVFDSIGREVNQVLEKTKPAVVRVKAEKDGIILNGTGFFIDEKGTILTSAMFISPDAQTSIEFKGKKLPARILGIDKRTNIAVLQISSGTTPFLGFAKSADLKPAAAVITVGYPFNLPAAANFGLISTFDTLYLDRVFPTTHIRANIPITQGMMGQPLLNTKGEILGVVVLAVEEGKSIYALPSDAAQKIVSDIRHHTRALHGWVGVLFNEATSGDDDEHRVKISQLVEGQPAASSGLKPGDIVLKIGDRDIRRPADASFFSSVGAPLAVSVRRDGKILSYTFNVSERPTSLPVTIQVAGETIQSTSPALPNAISVKGSEPSPGPLK